MQRTELTHWKRPWCWEDWRQEKNGTIEDEMVEWHHQLNGHESEQALGGGDRQGSLACRSPWSRRARHNWAADLTYSGCPTPRLWQSPPYHTISKAVILSSKDLGVLTLATESFSHSSFWEELAYFGDLPVSLLFLCNILHFSLFRGSWQIEELNLRALGGLQFNWYILWAIKLLHTLAVPLGLEGKRYHTPTAECAEYKHYTSNLPSNNLYLPQHWTFHLFSAWNDWENQTSRARVWKRSSRSLRRKDGKLGWQK